jgi:hypothetical protein
MDCHKNHQPDARLHKEVAPRYAHASRSAVFRISFLLETLGRVLSKGRSQYECI